MKWFKFFIGLFGLLPLAFVFSYAGAQILGDLFFSIRWWQIPLLPYFLMGLGIWLVLFFVIPRPMWLYVFGHELTHALWVWLFGGRIFGFKVSAKGGHVRTDTTNCWVALAPYFFPVYSVLVLWLWWLISFWLSLDCYLGVLFMILGITWGFHICFTLLMIPTVQSDITEQGWLFSLSLIYIINLLTLLIFLVAIAPELGWRELLLAFQEGVQISLKYLRAGLSFCKSLLYSRVA